MALAAIVGLLGVLVASPDAGVRPAIAPKIFLQEEQQQKTAQPETPPVQETTPAENAPQQTQPEPPPPVVPDAQAPVPADATPKPPVLKHKKPPAKKTAAKSVTKKTAKGKKPASGEAPKVVVRNGGTSDPKIQLSPSMSQQQTSQQLNNTTQLLDATDANLKKLDGQELNESQKETISQIRSYMQKAKAAVGVGDVQGAHNLAFKANLLSEELTKQ